MNGIMATRGRQGWERRERGESERFKFMKREENDQVWEICRSERQREGREGGLDRRGRDGEK